MILGAAWWTFTIQEYVPDDREYHEGNQWNVEGKSRDTLLKKVIPGLLDYYH